MNLDWTSVLAVVVSVLRFGTLASAGGEAGVPSGQMSLIRDMLESYDRKAKPTWDNERPINVTFSMDLYQILELNEPQQYILLNAWIIERWYDEFLYWNPLDYSNITELRLPYDVIWMPDTTLYNSLVMKDDDTRRLLNAKLTTNTSRRAVLIDLLYPAIFKFSCLLTLRYFPYDLQVCAMTFSSWTYDQKGIDYLPYADRIGTSNFLENEGWYLLQTSVRRKEVKYSCCPNNYTLLKLTLYLRRKPLFYLINLIIPTSIITLIAIVGFFTTSSASGMREEKVSLGITTLLSMSILMLMVSDQMPTTSTFIPLIGWFILGMIILISLGTLASTVVIAVQKRGRLGERLSRRAIRLAQLFGCLSLTDVPLHLREEARERRSAKFSDKRTTSNGASGHRIRSPDDPANYGRAVDVPATESRLARLLSRLQSQNRRRRAAADRIAPDKSTDLLVAEATGPDGTTLDDVFRFSSTPKAFQKRAKMRREGVTSTATPPNTGHNGRTDEISGISALLASSMFASSAVAGPPHIERLALRGFFADDDDEDDEDEEDDLTATSGFVTPAVGSRPPRPTHVAAALAANSARSGALTPAQLAQHARNFNEGQRRGRLLAQKEYEWVATVLERCCFLVFVIVFFVLTLGINFIGYSHWSDVEGALRRDGDERHT